MNSSHDQSKYSPQEIEPKWQSIWENDKIFSPNISDSKNPYYNLMMFPYPSAEGLHVGNMYAFTGADVYARFNRMQGKDVLEPIGLDGFGIHSENYAIKIGRHPKDQAKIAEDNFYRQLRSIGNSFDWNRTVETYDPDYYKWTQWLFIQLFKKGLAYRKKAEVNWCPSDRTVLSDEQVIDGKCERCGSEVEKKELEQWFFRITNYAERLLNNLSGLKWTEKVKIAQRNWIGKSEGAEVEFRIENSELRIKVFTTRPDTLYGVTFMVLSPENEISVQISQGIIKTDKKNEVGEYLERVKKKSNDEKVEDKDKTGVFTGLYAINPVNKEKIPVWISDYVLSGYGTGAIMAVPAHDERDFEFANKYNLPIIEVIQPEFDVRGSASFPSPSEDHLLDAAYTGSGKIINSVDWNGLEAPRDMDKILSSLEEKGLGERKANYHLRDWLISRQRYWGPPIPIIYCRNCWESSNLNRSKISGQEAQSSKLEYGVDYTEIEGLEYIIHPVPEADLPVELPDVADWKPLGTGKAPLANHPEFYNVACPECGGEARRETDVSDTFLDSSWYFLRYPSVGCFDAQSRGPASSFPPASASGSSEQMRAVGSPSTAVTPKDVDDLPFDPIITKKWLPVDQYIGGAEHSVLHLLYSRFITMALYDMGLIDFEEPFSNFYAHGLIIKDGAKMSKSKGNVVVPDEYIKKYGADSLRTYLMFLGPYSDGGDFRDSGIEGMHRFIKRVWTLIAKTQNSNVGIQSQTQNSKLEKVMNLTIKSVTEDISSFKYNTAIAKLMEYYNALNSHFGKSGSLDAIYVKNFLLLLAPFAPHMTEELWEQLSFDKNLSGHVTLDSRLASSSQANAGGQRDSSLLATPHFSSIHLQSWPEFDESKIKEYEVTIPVQINGKRRAEIKVQSSKIKDQSEIVSMGKESVSKYLKGQNIKKTIYVSGKILNFVV